jgi:hypothetical protein
VQRDEVLTCQLVDLRGHRSFVVSSFGPRLGSTPASFVRASTSPPRRGWRERMVASWRWLRLPYSRAEPRAAGVDPAGIGESVGVESAVVVQARQRTVLAAASHAARAGWEVNGAVGAGVGSTQGEDLHDVSIGAADLAGTRIGRHVWEGGPRRRTTPMWHVCGTNPRMTPLEA